MSDDDNLAKRFEAVFSKKPVANSGWDRSVPLDSTSHDADISWQATDETSLEDLLEELGAGDTSWIEDAKSLAVEGKQAAKLDHDDSNSVSKLLAEARARLKAHEQDESHDKKPVVETSETVDDKDDKAANSDDEADELLRQIQDSLSLEDTPEEKEDQRTEEHNEDEDEADEERAKQIAVLEGLNTLNTLPISTDKPSNSLSLPSVPTSQPGPKAKGKTTMNQKVDDLMDDIENWCCICNEDAVVKCLGCEGDLYCNECFNEGHRGKDAPYDMKTHKALAYNKQKPVAA